MEALFGRKFWDNVVLEFTHWSFDMNSVMQRNLTGKDETWKLDIFNKALQDMFHINITLTGVFVDSFSQQPWNIPDENQQLAFHRETSKLWTEMMEKEPFEFVTIEDILEELQFLRHENQRLNKIIEEDIATLREDLEINIIDTENNKELIIRNEIMIKNHTLKLEVEIITI